MKKTIIKNICLSGMFIALGIVLPFFTGQIPQIGNKLCPMHIPAMLCGLICGWPYGLIVGFVTPLLRSLIFSIPVMFPHAISMAFEIATYGFLCGVIINSIKLKPLPRIYISLILSMLGGRIIKGIVTAILYTFMTNSYTLSLFVTGAIINTIPGIVIQLVLIPLLILALQKAKLVNI